MNLITGPITAHTHQPTMIFETKQEREAYLRLIEASREAAEHERAFWDAREQEEDYLEPTWLAELEDALKGVGHV